MTKTVKTEITDIRSARWGRNLLCGAMIGAGAVLPGVSGGALAVAFGLYGPLMELLSHPRAALPRYVSLLPPLGVGWIVGFFGVAKCAAAAFHVSEAAATWLFIGLIAGTLPALYREAGQDGQNGQGRTNGHSEPDGQRRRNGRGASAWAALVLSAGTAFAALYCVAHVLHYTAKPSLFWYGVCGAVWGLSVVVPGLTSASVLMALGLYQPMLDGLARFDLKMFAACVPAMVLAAVLPARGVTWLLRRHHAAALHGILGLAAASTAAIVPTAYSGAGEAALSAACAAAGFLTARAVERWDVRSADGAERQEKC